MYIKYIIKKSLFSLFVQRQKEVNNATFSVTTFSFSVAQQSPTP